MPGSVKFVCHLPHSLIHCSFQTHIGIYLINTCRLILISCYLSCVLNLNAHSEPAEMVTLTLMLSAVWLITSRSDHWENRTDIDPQRKRGLVTHQHTQTSVKHLSKYHNEDDRELYLCDKHENPWTLSAVWDAGWWPKSITPHYTPNIILIRELYFLIPHMQN